MASQGAAGDRTGNDAGQIQHAQSRQRAIARGPGSIAIDTGGARRTATLIAGMMRSPPNAGPRAVRATGRLCYASSNRAVTALAHLSRYARFRQRRGL